MMLYVRMLFMMFLGLFTSRIVLAALGETDYGVYNVVGGVVSMFAIISGTLNASVSRFITFELGKGEDAQLRKVYSTAVTIQLALALLIAVLAEPTGLWFIENKMTIPPDRITAAKWVLHFSILSFVFNLMSVPQMAAITAHERMEAYSLIGILDGLLRFSTALLIRYSSSDRLILYSALMCLSVLLVRIAYGWYCRSHFPECRFQFVSDGRLFKEMFSFAGWNFIGVTAGVLRDHGGNILVNLFSNPIVNAARGLALQLSGAIQGFVTNFMTAVNPQITKSYASGDIDYMLSLVMKSSRMSYYLLLVIFVPVFANCSYLLDLWLDDVPETMESFAKLFMILSLSECLSNPLVTAALATGKIRNYQIIVGGLVMLNLPVSYLLLKAGAPPEVTVVVAIVISQICMFARLLVLKGMIGFPVGRFLKKVYLNVLAVTALALCFLPVLSHDSMNFGEFLLNVILCIVMTSLLILFVGCTRSERSEMIAFIRNRVRK